MMLGPLNHVGIAVPSIPEAIQFWRSVMGATTVHDPFDMAEQGVRVCFVDAPNTQVELLEPLGEDSPIANFLARNPLGGQHHLAFEVEDIEEARRFYAQAGQRILGPTRIGAHGTPVFFLHPKDMHGVLTEIMEWPPREG